MDVWVCTLVHADRDTGEVSCDLGGAGSLDELVAGLRANRGGVWDCWYQVACVERLASPVFAAGDRAAEARWYALTCPNGYGGEGMDAVPCDPPAWAFDDGEPLTLCALLRGVTRERRSA